MNRSPDTLGTHKDVVRRVYAEVWTQADFSNVGDLIGPQMVYHIRGHSIEMGPADLVEIVSRWKSAFPDIRFEVEALIAEGDIVAARILYTGTHRGEWKRIPPTGKQITVREMMFFRFEDERIVEAWEVTDEFSQREQLLADND
ncbi:MAG: ester cyclase [Anaerolineae bacterium]|jgi:hypothetical protein